MKKFSQEWWQHKDITMRWCHEFCIPFYREDPTLFTDPETYHSLGIVFFQKEDSEILPVGFTALQNGHFVFQYHPDYLERQDTPAISVTLPKREQRYELEGGQPDLSVTLPKRAERYRFQGKLASFFDNLPAEGWFGKAQGAALGQDIEHINGDGEPFADRYHRLMMFGRDCPGAAWVTYIHLDPHIAEEQHQETVAAALRSRSSISGVQPKLLGVVDQGKLRPTNYWETSTHIIKLPCDNMPSLMEYEYMSILATKALLPQDSVVDAALTELHLRDGMQRKVLAIKRFDRTDNGGKIHFEEFNQLLNKPNQDRYEGSYKEMADFIREKIGTDGVKQLYARVVAQLVLGNTDNHFKNFAMFHTNDSQWHLTPNYDLAPSVNFKKSAMALKIKDDYLSYVDLNPKVLFALGQDMGLEIPEITGILYGIKNNIEAAKETVRKDTSPELRCCLSDHKTTYQEDFCNRLEGRSQQLFGKSLDKYVDILARKNGNGGHSRLPGQR